MRSLFTFLGFFQTENDTKAVDPFVHLDLAVRG